MTTENISLAKKPPGSLVSNLAGRRCILFAGSGLSAWANLPTWRELLQSMIQKVNEEEQDMPYRQELDDLLKAGKLLEIADFCKEKLGERLYGEILTDRLRGDMGDIPEPHKVIVDLPFSAVVTTNYDKLLEQAYFSLGKGLPRTPTHTDIDTLGPLLFNGQFFILKAHGDIDRPGSLIFTTRDYREIIHSNPAFNAIFSAILLTRAILFLGYSMNDPDFRLLLDRQFTTFQGNVPERYALMSGVGEIERDVLWRSARIRVLPYSEHQEVLTFLEALRDDFLRLTLKRGPSV